MAEGDDLLADGDPGDNQDSSSSDAPANQSDDFDAGPPPSDVKYPDWVPSQFQAPEKRQELLDAIGVKAESAGPAERPEFLPEKFWKEGEGLQLEQFAKSYGELERKMHEKRPEPPETYEVKPPEGMDLPDDAPMLAEKDMEVFRELGLDNAGAQRLTEHFYETIVPVISQAKAETELANLAASWDMKPDDKGKMPSEFKQRLGKIKDWAENNLPDEIASHLRKSASGVQALYGMMEQKLTTPSADNGVTGKSDKELEQMIQSDEYWDPTNEALRSEVQKEMERRHGTA